MRGIRLASTTKLEEYHLVGETKIVWVTIFVLREGQQTLAGEAILYDIRWRRRHCGSKIGAAV